MNISDDSDTSKVSRYVKNNIEPVSHNPWINATAMSLVTRNRVSTVKVLKDGNDTIMDGVTGEVLESDHLGFAHLKKVDTERFIKMYSGAVQAFFDLSPKAIKVLKVVLIIYRDQNMYHFRPDQVGVDFSYARECGYEFKERTFRCGINELCNKEIIAPVKAYSNMYWVNPQIFFKGDRVTYIESYLLDDSATDSNPESPPETPKPVLKPENSLFAETDKNEVSPYSEQT